MSIIVFGRFLILFFTIAVTLEAATYQAIEKFDNGDGTERIRVHLNYNNLHLHTQRLGGADGRMNLDLPIPDKWELLDVSGYIKYTSSLLMLEEHSSATILLNDVVIDQFRLFARTKTGIMFKIDPLLFGRYNTLTFQAIQHYTLQCEDPSSNQLWTDIDLKESYIDFLVRPKPVDEKMASFDTRLFDQKQYSITPLNYVMNDTDDTVLKNYSLFTAVASTHLKYKMERIAVSSSINSAMHNIIIATKEEAREVLKALDGYYLFSEKPSYALDFDIASCRVFADDIGRDKNSTSDGFTLKKDENASGSYAHFNGGFIRVPKSSTTEENMIAMWIRSDIQEGEKFLFGTKHYAVMLSEGSIGFSSGADNLFGANIALEDNEWHYIVATFSQKDLNSSTIMIDGKELQLEQLRGVTAPVDSESERHFHIAARSFDDIQAFHGDMDQLYLFDHLLTDGFAQKLYKTALSHREKRMNGTLFIDEKISHDINIIQNPFHIENAIVVIAPKNAEKIEQCITALYKTDLVLYNQIGLDINKSTIPVPAQPYTAKKFVPLDQKIYFKELGYNTTLLKGQYPPKVVLDFKVYPDNFFDSSDQMQLNLHTVLPTVVRDDSVVNIYLNQKFAKQIDIVRSAEESKTKIDIENLFDWDSLMNMSAYLVGQGYNRLSVDFSLIPKKENFCEVFNTENLVATLLDDSYFILPKAERWIELPYLQLIPNSSYPYSIYPDLQQTTILLTNKSLPTIAASMNFIFYLTQQIDSYPYYLHITDMLDSKTKASHIVAFGTAQDKLMHDLSQNAPLVIDKERVGRTYPFIEKFVAYKSILDEERTKKYSFRNSTIESKQVGSNLILQMIRSPYDTQKTIVMAIAENDHCLENGIFSIFQEKNRGKVKGDLVIYNYKSEIAKSFNVKDKYIISDLNWLDTISLMIGANPLFYLSMLFLILVIVTFILRSFLLRFKEEHHKDAE